MRYQAAPHPDEVRADYPGAGMRGSIKSRGDQDLIIKLGLIEPLVTLTESPIPVVVRTRFAPTPTGLSMTSTAITETYPRLIGDIGGTNARFALIQAPGESFGTPQVLPTANFETLEAAILHFLDGVGGVQPRWGAFGIANPVTGDRVKMTNHHWAFSIEALRKAVGLDRLWLHNDFTALALSLPVLPREELRQLGGDKPAQGAPLALLGAGTGLGVSGLFMVDGKPVPINGEGGHVTLPAFDEREATLLGMMRDGGTHISAERVLSGPGMQALYQTICALNGQEPEPLSAADISRRGLADDCPMCASSLRTFCEMLGTIASDLALTLGARGGVYVGGGIIPKLGEYFAQSGFRNRFENKGRFREYLAPIPVYVIHSRYPGLIGVAHQLELDAARET